jgi:flagellar biosynthesis protein FlhA
LLTEHVRRRLGHAICQGLVGEGTALHVMTLDPLIESRLMQGLQSAEPASQSYAIEPRLAEQFMSRMVKQAEQMMKSNLLPVLLCAPDLRRHVRSLCERAMPHLRVLSMAEIPQTIELKSYSVVTL